MTSLTWARRRRSLGEFWRIFRRNKRGMIGLAILAFFTLAALLAPLLVDLSLIHI